MTPAVTLLQKAGVDFRIHQYDHDPEYGAYGEEAAEKIGVDPARVFKTLIVQLDSAAYVVAIIPVRAKLDLKMAAKSGKAKKASLAVKDRVAALTGYIPGGVSPLAQKKKLTTYIDRTASEHQTIFVSGGKRGLDVELSFEDLARLTGGVLAPLCR